VVFFCCTTKWFTYTCSHISDSFATWIITDFFFFFFGLFAFSRAAPRAYGGSQARGRQSCSLPPMPEPQQREIWAVSVTYTTAHGNARFLTHWARSGIKPATSWFLVRFVNHCALTGTPITDYWVEFSVLYSRSPLASDTVYLSAHMKWLLYIVIDSSILCWWKVRSLLVCSWHQSWSHLYAF